MRIQCNLPGGFKFFGVSVTYGENIVDDDVWREIESKLSPRFFAGLIRDPPGDMPPYLVIRADDDALSEPDAPPLTPDAPPQISARDKIALVEAATTYDQLSALEEFEHRKTVLTAIYKRAEQIDREGKDG